VKKKDDSKTNTKQSSSTGFEHTSLEETETVEETVNNLSGLFVTTVSEGKLSKVAESMQDRELSEILEAASKISEKFSPSRAFRFLSLVLRNETNITGLHSKHPLRLAQVYLASQAQRPRAAEKILQNFLEETLKKVREENKKQTNAEEDWEEFSVSISELITYLKKRRNLRNTGTLLELLSSIMLNVAEEKNNIQGRILAARASGEYFLNGFMFDGLKLAFYGPNGSPSLAADIIENALGATAVLTVEELENLKETLYTNSDLAAEQKLFEEIYSSVASNGNRLLETFQRLYVKIWPEGELKARKAWVKAQVESQLGNIEAQKIALQELVEQASKTSTWSFLPPVGAVDAVAKNLGPETAAEFARHLEELNPHVHLRIAKAYLEAGQAAKAVEHLRSSPTSDPTETMLLQLEASLALADRETAIEQVRAVMSGTPVAQVPALLLASQGGFAEAFAGLYPHAVLSATTTGQYDALPVLLETLKSFDPAPINTGSAMATGVNALLSWYGLEKLPELVNYLEHAVKTAEDEDERDSVTSLCFKLSEQVELFENFSNEERQRLLSVLGRTQEPKATTSFEALLAELESEE